MLKRITIPIAILDDGSDPATGDVVLWLKNPSVLLSCLVAIVLQPARAANNALAFSANAVWQIYPVIPAGGPILEHQILGPVFVDAAGAAAPRRLPDGYAFLDPTKLARITATIEAANTEGETGYGAAYAVATWEPTDPSMSRALWDDLIGDVELAIEGVAARMHAGG